jgi:hypothetical protein
MELKITTKVQFETMVQAFDQLVSDLEETLDVADAHEKPALTAKLEAARAYVEQLNAVFYKLAGGV